MHVERYVNVFGAGDDIGLECYSISLFLFFFFFFFFF